MAALLRLVSASLCAAVFAEDGVLLEASSEECIEDACGDSSVNLLQLRSRKVSGGHGSAGPEAPAAALPASLVDWVYTFGAPATKRQPFRNAADPSGCFQGLRSYTEDLKGVRGSIHQVDAAAINNYYPHAWIGSVVLRWQADSIYTPCDGITQFGHPDWPQRGSQVYEQWTLHQENDYTDRLRHVTVNGQPVAEEEPFRSANLFVEMAYRSYGTVADTKASLRRRFPEWTLVAHISDKHGSDEDPVMVVQQNDTLNCALMFTGTNDLFELTTSTTNYGTGFCGFEGVHVGYRNELWTITGDTWSTIRPVLEQCNQVTCVGHSLGGAVCEVFAACANSGNYSDPDFQRLAWMPKVSARRMAEFEE